LALCCSDISLRSKSCAGSHIRTAYRDHEEKTALLKYSNEEI
jgi:hypothetical protein